MSNWKKHVWAYGNPVSLKFSIRRTSCFLSRIVRSIGSLFRPQTNFKYRLRSSCVKLSKTRQKRPMIS